jgi:DNA-binding beta-propeller fold protein YncE
MTEPIKKERMRAYGRTAPMQSFQFDHAIPIALGGATSTANLWPQERQAFMGAEPFTGLNYPGGVAVDSTGALYVNDVNNNRVLKLAAGSSTPTELPFTGLNAPVGVVVDSTGNVYVTDGRNNRVLKLPVQ